MPTSGTASYSIDAFELIEEAAERAGVEIRGGYEFMSAVRSLNLLAAEWANRGINLWTVDQETAAVSTGVARYALPADTVDIITQHVRLGATDFRVERIGVGSYASIAQKTQVGRPTQCYVERLADVPYINLWPVPDQNYTLIYWRMRRIQDITAGGQTADIPYRFWPPLVSGLAYYIALKKVEATGRVQLLKQIYEEEFERAAYEDRGRESFRIVPQATK